MTCSESGYLFLCIHESIEQLEHTMETQTNIGVTLNIIKTENLVRLRNHFTLYSDSQI